MGNLEADCEEILSHVKTLLRALSKAKSKMDEAIHLGH